MAIIKKIPAFQTPDGQLFDSLLDAERHQFNAYIRQQFELQQTQISQTQLDALWAFRFDLAHLILTKSE